MTSQCQMQCCVTLAGGRVELSSVANQSFHHHWVALVCSNVESSQAIYVLNIDVTAWLEGEYNNYACRLQGTYSHVHTEWAYAANMYNYIHTIQCHVH